uniref:Rev protein n=1 Tax=Simian immunodeficiency virus TaxID=11723 RepID=A0A0A7RS93_SIV|nr:rev protein [Simian immunodeficiency virus]
MSAGPEREPPAWFQEYQRLVTRLWQGRIPPRDDQLPQTARQRKRRRARQRRVEYQIRALQARIFKILEQRNSRDLVEGIERIHLAEERESSS